MVCFQIKNPNFGKIGGGLGIENMFTFYGQLQPFGIVCGNLVYFSVLVCLDLEKSGNPGL
jgi:hypothetical protein